MKKILIIEDDVILATALTDNLTHEGYIVICAVDGVEGLASALKEKPNLILLDILLPRMNGIEMLAKLREDEWGAKVPVIVLSNVNEPKEIEKAVGDDVSEYLLKVNWTIEAIIKRINEKLKT